MSQMSRKSEDMEERDDSRLRARRGIHLAASAARPAKVEALWTPALLRLLAAAATWGFAHACFVLLPKYLAVELGVGPREIGRTMGAFGLASVPVAGLVGILVDRRPTRIALGAGSILLALSALGFAASHTFGPHIYALRAVQALANALVVTAVGVAVTEIAPASRLSQAIGLTGATMLAMNAIAPMAMEPLAATAGWNAVFLVAALVAIASLVLVVSLREPRPHHGVAHHALVDAVDAENGFPLGYAAVSAASGVAFGTVMAFQQPLSLAAGRADVSGFLSAFAAGALGLRLLAGSLPDRIGRRRAAVLALTAYALGTAALGVVPSRFMNVMGLCLGLSHGLFFPRSTC